MEVRVTCPADLPLSLSRKAGGGDGRDHGPQPHGAARPRLWGMGWGLGGDVVIGSSSQAFPRSHSGQTASQRNAIHDLTGPRKNMLQDGGFVQVNRELHPQPHKARNIFPGVREGGLSPSCAFSVQARDLTDAVPPFLSSSPQVPSTCLTRVDKQDRCQ